MASEDPFLEVIAPDAERGRRIGIGIGHSLIGRGDGCDVRFDDPFVSRTHAGLTRRGAAVWVRDLHSSSGTLVNGVPARDERELHSGDVLTLADIQLRFTGPGPDRETGARSFAIGAQHDGTFNNVGGDQWNVVQQQRESFLRHVAAARTRARWLIVSGFVLIVCGFGIFATTVLRLIGTIGDLAGQEPQQPRIPEDWREGNLPAPGPTINDPFGAEIAGIPAGLLGWAIAGIGGILLVIGIVMHVVAAARARHVDRDYPLPPAR